MKVKVLVIANMFPGPKHQFYGIYVKNFVDNFAGSNIEIISKSIIRGQGENLIEKTKKYLGFFLSIFKNLLFTDYDIVYVHYPSYASLPILTCLPFIHQPIVLNFHGTDVLSSSKISKILQFLVKPLISKCLCVVVPSKTFKKIVAAKFNVAKEKIFISPSGGVDTKMFRPLKKNKFQSHFTIGYVGRIDEGKGWDVFLQTCAILKSMIPELRCLIVGNGRQVNDFQQTVFSLGVSDNITFLGSVPHNELSAYYNQLDIFIFPTLLHESLGLVGIEALSCGVPVIGSRIGGLEDYIIEDGNGYLFEPGNSKELAKKVLHLYENEKTLQKFKLEARNSIECFDKQRVVQNLSSKLEQIYLVHNKNHATKK